MLNSVQTDKLWEKIKSKSVVSLASYDGKVIRSRPMKRLQEQFNGTLWFITSLKADMVADIHQHPFVNITVDDEKNDVYASLIGNASLSNDRAQLSTLWNSDVESWFDGGIDDENVALIAVEITEAEYWDVNGSQIKQAFNAMFSKANGKVPSQAVHRTLT